MSVAASLVNDDDVAVNLLTGAGLANCASFDSLALTVDDSSVPLVFSYDCVTSVIQPELISLPPGDGVKTIRLWARDSEGAVSSLPSTVTVTLDKTAPTVTFSAPTGEIRGGVTTSLAQSITDNNGIASAQLYLSINNGTTFTLVSSLDPSASSFSFVAPASDVAQAVLRIVAVDNAGNVRTVNSAAFSIDGTAPTAPVINLTSATVTNSLNATISVSSCTGLAGIFFNETGTAPSPTDPSWHPCGASLTHTLSGSTNGTRRIYAFSKDAVGNISGSSSVDLTYDSVAPDPSLLRLDSPLRTNQTTVSASASSCSGVSAIILKSTSTAPSVSDPGWATCSTSVNSVSANIPSVEGAQIVYGFAKDVAGNISSARAFTVTYDITPPQLTQVIINPSTSNPAIGDEYTATVFVNVKITFDEPFSGSSIRLSQANPVSGLCIQDSSPWVSVAGTGTLVRTLAYQFSSGDGTKKVCAWVRDSSGNQTVISGAGALGVNVDTIKFEVGNIPIIKTFNAVNNADGTLDAEANQIVTAFWDISDVEGLDSNPITIDYTLNNTTWIPLTKMSGEVVTNYGGLSGNPVGYVSSLSFYAPSSNYFRLRMKVKDVAGNDSITAYAAPFNTNPWLIYAGSSDNGVGSGGLSTSMTMTVTDGSAAGAFDPVRGDLYMRAEAGLVKIDIKTGKSSFLMRVGANNLPDSGVLPADPRITSKYSLEFSANGSMYLLVNHAGADSAKLFKLDPETRAIQYLAGGGSDYTALDNPAALNLVFGRLAVDESENVYGFLHCSASASVTAGTSAFKLVKISPAGVITHIAGNCTKATPFPSGFGPVDPLTHSLGDISYHNIGDLAVKENGNVIVYSFAGQFYKIINGQLYRSQINKPSAKGFKFRSDGKLLMNEGGVYLVSVDSTPANLDVIEETFVDMDYTLPDCIGDGKLKASACAVSYFKPLITHSGQMMYIDGPITNGTRKARVRYLDEAGRVQTFAGTLSVFGEDYDKSVFRGKISSIAYQTAANANADFPEGLYIGAYEATSYYYINPTSGKVTRILGNGIGAGSGPMTGPLSPSSNLGAVYGQGFNAGMLAFNEGYPYMRINNKFYKIGEGKVPVPLLNGATSWDDLAIGGSPLPGYLPAGSLVNNITFKDNGVFITGVGARYADGTSTGNNSASIRYMDFTQNKVVKIMGNNGTNAETPDITTDTDLRPFHLNMNYSTQSQHFTQYDKLNDRFYFMDGLTKIRYITAPGTNASKLITVLNIPGLQSFTLRPDGSSLFYIKSDGNLYCHNLGTAPAWCDGVTPVGPTVGLPKLVRIPNQFAWKNNNTLYVTEGNVIMQFNL